MNGDRRTARVRDVKVHVFGGIMLVEVQESGGQSGWCEVGGGRPALSRQILESVVAGAAKDSSVWDAEPLWEKVRSGIEDTGAAGLAALSALDVAMWDLRGKVAGLAVHKLLGGRSRSRVAACATIAVDSANLKGAAAEASRLRAAGYSTLRLALRPGEIPLNAAGDPAVLAVAAVRAQTGSAVEIIVNLGGAYMSTRAVEIARLLHRKFGVRYLEDPTPPEVIRDLAQVSDGSDALVCAGGPGCTRWAARELIDQGKADVIAPDLGTSGGITEAKKVAALAQSQSKPLMPRAPRGVLLQAAALQLAASVLTVGPALDRTHAENAGPYRGIPEFRDGFMLVPNAPGLGVEVDRERAG